MIALSSIFWIMIVFFGLIGMMRGWAKEIIVTAGVVLALFAEEQFGERAFVDPVTGAHYMDPQQEFILRAGFFVIVTFFAYQTPGMANEFTGGKWSSKLQKGLQEAILGFIIGMVNGYLIVGSLWWYADQLGYPFPGYVVPPDPFSPSGQLVPHLPPAWLSSGVLLPMLVVVLFLFVIIVMI